MPVQAKRSGLVSIQEVGIGETPAVEEQGFYHGFSAIVEETADNLEILHRRRRRSHARRSDTVNEETTVFVPSLNEAADLESSVIADASIEEVVEQTQIIEPEVEQTEVLSTEILEPANDRANPIDWGTVSVDQTEVLTNDDGPTTSNTDVSETGVQNSPDSVLDVQETDVDDKEGSDLVRDILSPTIQETVGESEINASESDSGCRRTVQRTRTGYDIRAFSRRVW